MSFPRRHYVQPKAADQMSKEMVNREIQNMQQNLDVTIAQLEATFKDIIKTDSRICQTYVTPQRTYITSQIILTFHMICPHLHIRMVI